MDDGQEYKEGKFSTREVSKYISACKLKAPSLAFEVFKHVMLWFGAYGYTKECPLEMGLRGVMSYMIGAEGTPNIQRIIIARELLEGNTYRIEPMLIDKLIRQHQPLYVAQQYLCPMKNGAKDH